MILKANIDYEREPEAIINFMEVEKDIYPFLSKAQQKKINKDYNLTIDLNVTPAMLRNAMPQEWKQYLKLRRYIKKVIKPHQYNYKEINEYRKKINKEMIRLQKKENTQKYAPFVKKSLQQTEKTEYIAPIIAE